MLCARGARRDDPRGRSARAWIIQHCPHVNRLVLGDINLLLLEKSWKLGQNKHSEAKGGSCLCVCLH